MEKKVIVIDPGHGCNKYGIFKRPLMRLGLNGISVLSGGMIHPKELDPRAYREDIGTLKIAKALRSALECMNFEVHLTREDEREVALYQTQKFIEEHDGIGLWRKAWPSWKWTKWFTKQKKADLFISIHTNAGGGSGPVAFYSSNKSKKLGKILCSKISENFDLTNRGTKKKRFLILRNTAKGNEVLFEVMFHDSPVDLKYLISNTQINKMGQAIAEGIYEFLQYDSRKEGSS